MDTVTADDGHSFTHPAQLASIEDVMRALVNGQQIVYYVGESLGIAKVKSKRVGLLATRVWQFVVDGNRGRLHLRKVESREDGLNRYEYIAIPSKSVYRN